MTLTGFNRFCSALVLLAALCEFSMAAHAENLASIFTNVAPAATKAIPRRASIIFIQCDGLGYGDLSCYGQTNFQTPNLDKLAAEGIQFTNYFADADSLSSQAALMLGKNPERAGVLLAPEEITVAQILKNSGYHTGLIGEWNLGDENSSGAPWRKGFDEFAGYLNPVDAQNFYADYMWRLNPNFTYDESHYDKINGHWREWNKANGPPTPGKEIIYANTQGKNQYIPDLLTKAALNFVKVNQPDKFNRFRPFFLLVNYPVPHAGKTLQVPSDAPYSDEPWPQPEKNKAAIITRLDGYIGELQQQLQKFGLTNNVAIFFTSDTPPKKSAEIDPDFFHSNISTNDLRVSMIVHWQDKIPAGQVSGFKWSPRDFLPTAAQIAFVNSPTNLDGISILPTLFGQTQKDREEFLKTINPHPPGG